MIHHIRRIALVSLVTAALPLGATGGGSQAAEAEWARLIVLAQADTSQGQSYADSMLERARSLLAPSGNQRDPELAARILIDSASMGSISAMLMLADLYTNGDGVPKDVAKAEKLLLDAISSGNVRDGSYALGNLYRTSDPPDIAGAVTAYQQAIDAGNTGAMLTLAEMLRAGDGVPVDVGRARSLIEASIAAGNVGDGADALGDLYRLADPPNRNPVKAAEAYQMAVDAGNIGAMLVLAEMLRRGDGIPADPERALALIEASIAAGNVGGGALALGEFHRLAGQSAEALAAYEQAIGAGNSWAMLALAAMLRTGDGVPVDVGRARSLIEASIAAGNVSDGADALGDLYRLAEPPVRDPAKAAEAYQQAIDAGNTGAMLVLAEMVRTGDGVSVDMSRARALIEASIAAGNVRSGALALGNLYRSAVPPDIAGAVAAYEQAIEAGNSWAMLALAEMLRTGDGVSADIGRARSLIEASIAAGNVSDGADALGDLYRQAQPPDRDPAKAVEAYQLAVDAGNTSAMLTLAEMLRRGDGIPADPERALSLIEASIAAGNVRGGALALGEFHRRAGQPAEAIAAYQQAIEAGNSWAMLALAEMLRTGDGVPTDPERALVLIEASIAAGNVGDGALALGNFYRLADPPQIDNAIAAYQQAIDAGNVSANLLAARLMSGQYLEPASRRAMVGHLLAAAKVFSPTEVALDILQLPTQSLIAAVQQLLADNGQRVGTPDGYHGARTKRAIREFCTARQLTDCDEDFITISLVAALLTPS